MSDVTAPFQFDTSLPGAQATITEIAQQAEAWREVASVVAALRPQLDAFITPLLDDRRLRIIMTGAGTSAFVGEIAAPSFAGSLGVRADAIASTDLVSNPTEYLAEDVPTLLVSFARSGNSPESVAATDLVTQLVPGAHHLVVTCDGSGALARHHDNRDDSFVLVMPERTNDVGFAMTSSFSSMLLAALLVFHPETAANADMAEDDDLVAHLSAAGAELFLREQGPLRDLARRGFERVVYLGSGPLKGLARESALKLLELTAGRIVTYFDSPLGFRHGPKAVLNDHTLVIVYVSSDPQTRKYDLDLIAEVRASQPEGSVVVISAGPAGTPDDESRPIAGLQGVPDAFLAVVFISIAQILGFAFALEVGTTPDNPFPGGSVNRVVTGVTVYPLDITAGPTP